MNNTTIFCAPTRNQEKQLSEKLYLNLHALTKYEKPRQEFMDIFTSSQIFLNLTTKSLLEILHYLFNLLDPKEFAKRFIWPVFDKKTEAEFRSVAINYLNILKHKYNLRYETVKTHILVKPSGQKFLIVLYEIMKLVMKEIIQKWQKSNPNEELKESYSCNELKSILENTKNHAEIQMKFIEELKSNSKKLIEQTDEIQQHLSELSITFPHVVNHNLITQWNQRLDRNFIDHFKPQFLRIFSFNNSIEKLWLNIEQIFTDQSENIIKFNDANLPKFLNENDIQLQLIQTNGQINFANLLIAFEQSVPLMIKISKTVHIKPNESLCYEGECIKRMYEKVLQTEAIVNSLSHQIFLLQKSKLNESKMIDSDKVEASLPLSYELMSTPPIKLIKGNKLMTKGLALVDSELTYKPILLKNTEAVSSQARNRSFSNASLMGPDPLSSSSKLNASMSVGPLHTTLKATQNDPVEFLKQLHQRSVDRMKTNKPRHSTAAKTPMKNINDFDLSSFLKSPDTTSHRRFRCDQETTLMTSPSSRLTSFLEYDEDFLKISTPKLNDHEK